MEAERGPIGEADVEALKAMPIDELIARASKWTQHGKFEMELQRRAMEVQIELTTATSEFKAAADKSSSRMLAATWVLVVLTVAIAVLTAVLVLNPPKS